MNFDRVWSNARLATVSPSLPGLGIVERGVVGAVDGRLAFVGPAEDRPQSWNAHERIDCDGRWITPVSLPQYMWRRDLATRGGDIR